MSTSDDKPEPARARGGGLRGRLSAWAGRAGGWWSGSAQEGPASPEPPPAPVPVVWLLGKTGAGKSSLIRAMTGAEAAEIGNGFSACTRTARAFDYPPDLPAMRFLDTRGLGEVAYDPAADLAEIGAAAHIALVLMRIGDPVQGAIAEALARIRRSDRRLAAILVHTGADQAPDSGALARAVSANQRLIEAAWGGPLPSLTLDLSDPAAADLDPLRDALVGVLPAVALYMAEDRAADEEEAAFARNRGLVLGYAGSASGAGALPLVGAVSVPALQIAMLNALAGRYGVDWGRERLAELAAALGAGVIGGQAVAFAAREAAKLIPVVGQTVAPVAGAGWGFASTYALGRAAAWWLHRQSRGEKADEEELRRRFAEALRRAGAAEGRK